MWSGYIDSGVVEERYTEQRFPWLEIEKGCEVVGKCADDVSCLELGSEKDHPGYCGCTHR